MLNKFKPVVPNMPREVQGASGQGAMLSVTEVSGEGTEAPCLQRRCFSEWWCWGVRAVRIKDIEERKQL